MSLSPSEISLPGLLSQILVAFTIEVDNAWEKRRPHTWEEGRRIPGRGFAWFLVSLPMWANFLRFLDDKGQSMDQLEAKALAAREPVGTNVGGLERWGYVHVRPGGEDKPIRKPGEKNLGTNAGIKPSSLISISDSTVDPKAWTRLPGSVEKRWNKQFGDKTMSTLRALLEKMIEGLEREFPRSLPILSGPLSSPDPPAYPENRSGERTDLSALLAPVLLAFTADLESRSSLSLPVCSNVLRVLTIDGVPEKELPSLGGVSKEASSWILTVLRNAGLTSVKNEKPKTICLTNKGNAAKEASRKTLETLEADWSRKLPVSKLRSTLEVLYKPGKNGRSLLGAGMEPSAGLWRASKDYIAQTTRFVADPALALPQYPTVLHRGAWPDGS